MFELIDINYLNIPSKQDGALDGNYFVKFGDHVSILLWRL